MAHKQHKYWKVILAGIALSLAGCSSPESEQNETVASQSEENATMATMVYVGTYAAPDQESIWLYNLDTETGEISQVLGIQAGENPSYLALDKEKRYLYAVNETGNYEGKNSGAVSAFAIDRQTGNLTLLHKLASQGGAPCHISLDEPNKTVLVANYVGGNVAAFPIQADGTLGEPPIVHPQNPGAGPNKDRQEAAHAHWIGPSPDGGFAFAVDLGTDEVLRYTLDSEKATMTGKTVAFKAQPGAGPRHLVFHPSGKFAYVINELNSTMTALAFDAAKGELSELQTTSTLPADYTGNNSCAAVKVSVDGRFLYGSNRGHNSIVVYAINGQTGKLTLVQHQDTGGDWPRDFTLDKTGNILLVANERSNSIVSFKRDKENGRLRPAGHEVNVQKPVCLQVVEAIR